MTVRNVVYAEGVNIVKKKWKKCIKSWNLTNDSAVVSHKGHQTLYWCHCTFPFPFMHLQEAA